MPGFREGEVFKADSLLELLNQMYMKHYTILDPFDIIITDLLSLK